MESKKDYLGREQTLQELLMVVNTLSREKRGCTFAIDGKWGCGKSFLLDMFEEQASVLQNEENMDDRYFIVRYDCWKYDYYTEPIIAILSALREQIEKTVSLIPEWKDSVIVNGAISKLKMYLEECSGKLLESKWGFNPIEIYHQCLDEGEEQKVEKHQFDTYYTLKEVLISLREQLEKISQTRTIVFIVDELDRCLPEYALKVLESLHHVFSGISNFITILAIDRTVLQKVVEKGYGTSIDTDAYLKKIVDFYFCLDFGIPSAQYMEKCSAYRNKFYGNKVEVEWVKELLLTLMNGLEVRAQEKILLKAELLHDIIADGVLDISCMAFELLWLCWNYRHPGGDLRKSFGEDENWNKSIWGMIWDNSSLNRKVSISGRNYYELSDDIASKLKWYIENIYEEEKKGYCGRYYYEECEKYRGNTEKMKGFVHMSRLLK